MKGWQEGVGAPYTPNAMNDRKLSPSDRSVGTLGGFRGEGEFIAESFVLSRL